MHTTRLTKIGNSTGLTLPRDVLAEAHLERGDEISIQVRDGRIEISKSDDAYNRTVNAGLRCIQRYRRALSGLAK